MYLVTKLSLLIIIPIINDGVYSIQYFEDKY